MIATRATISENEYRRLEPGYFRRDYLISTPRVRSSSARRLTEDGWLDYAQEQLSAIGELNRGWDSHGAAPPAQSAIQGAWNLLLSLYETRTVPKPHIYPTRSGGIQFEWELGQRYLEIELLSETEAAYFYSDLSTRFETEGTLREGESLDEVIGLISRVRGH